MKLKLPVLIFVFIIVLTSFASSFTFYDDFNRATIGTNYTCLVVGGCVTITNNQMVVSTGGYALLNVTTWSDFNVTFITNATGNDGFQFVFSWIAQNNHGLFLDDGARQLYWNDGTYKLLTSPAGASGGNANVRVQKSGNNFTIFVNGSLVSSWVNGNFSKVGMIGFRGDSKTWYIDNLNITDGNETAPPPPSIPTIGFNEPPTTPNRTSVFLEGNITFNITTSNGQIGDLDLLIYNSTGSLVKAFCTGCTVIQPSVYTALSLSATNTIQTTLNTKNYSSIQTTMSLPVGAYYYNATYNNGTYYNETTTRTFYIYNLTIGTMTTPTNNSQVSGRFLVVNWTNTTVTPSGTTVSQSYINLSLLNSDLTLNRTITLNNGNNTISWDFYSQNLSTGIYYLRMIQVVNDNSSKTIEHRVNFTTNAQVNITARAQLTNSSISTFNVTIAQLNITYTTTNGLVQVDIVKGVNYNFSIVANNQSSSSVLYSTNNTYSNLIIYLYLFNSLYIRFLDELTGQLITNNRVYLDLISDIYSASYNTTSGNLTIGLLSPTVYDARYEAENYTERFYQFTINDDSAQNLDLYLLRESAAVNVTISIIDQNTLPLEGAVVKALKFDIATNSYLTVEIGVTDVSGQVVMDLTLADEYYKFIVIVDGEIVKITDPAYIYSQSLTIQVIVGEEAFEDYDIYKNIVVSLYFEESTNTTVFFYNDLNNLNTQFCLEVYKVKNLTNLLSQTLLGSNCSTASSDTLTYTIAGQNGDLFLANTYYLDNGIITPLSQLYISFDNQNINTGRDGVWIQIIVTIIFCIFAFGHPELLPLIIPLSLVLGRMLNLTKLSLPVLLGFLVLGIMITWAINWIRKS